jgi:hypothetical protein
MKKQLLWICPTILLTTSIRAAPISTGCISGSLTTYDTSAFSCSIGNVVFSNFFYATSGNLIPDSTVRVDPVNDGTDLGFLITGPFESVGGMLSAAVLSYQINVASGLPLLTGNTLALTSYGASGGGHAIIVEHICTTPPQGNGACKVADTADSLDVFYNSGPPASGNQAAAVAFASPTAFEAVTSGIVPNGGGGSAAILQFESTVQVVLPQAPGDTPEPSTLTLLGAALVAVALLLRKRARA